MGMILGIIGIVVLLVAVWYFALGPGAGAVDHDEQQRQHDQPAGGEPAGRPGRLDRPVDR